MTLNKAILLVALGLTVLVSCLVQGGAMTAVYAIIAIGAIGACITKLPVIVAGIGSGLLFPDGWYAYVIGGPSAAAAFLGWRIIVDPPEDPAGLGGWGGVVFFVFSMLAGSIWVMFTQFARDRLRRRALAKAE